MARLVGRTRSSYFVISVVIAAVVLLVLTALVWMIAGQPAPALSGSMGV